jgi:hypothetical protein
MTTPHGLEAIKETFGDPTHFMTDDGRVEPGWEFAAMGFARLPMPVFLAWDTSKTIEKIYCNRKIIPIFEDVFQKIYTAGLWEHVKLYGGCYTWRLKRVNAQLSTHCWGISVDLNPATNGLGTVGNQNVDVVDIFEDAGFIWGGRWTPLKNRDSMHWQYCSGY